MLTANFLLLLAVSAMRPHRLRSGNLAVAFPIGMRLPPGASAPDQGTNTPLHETPSRAVLLSAQSRCPIGTAYRGAASQSDGAGLHDIACYLIAMALRSYIVPPYTRTTSSCNYHNYNG